jgi:hypothetical protein
MTEEELNQKHLEFAVNEALQWFRNVPQLRPRDVQSRIVDCIHRQFAGHDLPLTQFELVTLNAQHYTVTVNKTAFASLTLPNVKDNEFQPSDN